MVVFQCCVLGSWTETPRLCHRNAGLIVLPDFATKVWLVDVQREDLVNLFHKSHSWCNFSQSGREGDALSLRCAQSCLSLWLRLEADGTLGALDHEPCL